MSTCPNLLPWRLRTDYDKRSEEDLDHLLLFLLSSSYIPAFLSNKWNPDEGSVSPLFSLGALQAGPPLNLTHKVAVSVLMLT